jgi:uncharacterized membrane protein YoaK (UPF0700 family)
METENANKIISLKGSLYSDLLILSLLTGMPLLQLDIDPRGIVLSLSALILGIVYAFRVFKRRFYHHPLGIILFLFTIILIGLSPIHVFLNGNPLSILALVVTALFLKITYTYIYQKKNSSCPECL